MTCGYIIHLHRLGSLRMTGVYMILLALFAGCMTSIDTLIHQLKDRSSSTRRLAAESLGRRKDSRAVRPLLSAALYDEDAVVRIRSSEALGKIGDPSAIESLMVMLKNEDSLNQQRAYPVLGNIGPLAVEPLITALKDEQVFVRRCAVHALNITRDARSVKPLGIALADSDTEVRRWAALVMFGINNHESVTLLRKAVGNQDLKLVANNYVSYILKGDTTAESLLLLTLRIHGDNAMALTFLNCDNSILKAAGGEWAIEHGYMLKQRLSSDANTVKWGNKK